MRGNHQNRQNRNKSGDLRDVSVRSDEIAAKKTEVAAENLSGSAVPDGVKKAMTNLTTPNEAKRGQTNLIASEAERKTETKTAATDAVENAEHDSPAKSDATVRKFGTVANCGRLNVRRLPDADAEVVTQLPAGSEVMIDVTGSTDAFYKVCTAAGIDGWCMRRYIEINP